MNTDETRRDRDWSRDEHPGGVPLATVWGRRLIILAALGAIGWNGAVKASKANQLEKSLDARFAAREQTFRAEAKADEQRLQSELAMLTADQARQLQNPQVIDGSLARSIHEGEWRRREAHDPAMARSATERSLLQMEQLGADPKLSAQAALEKVATLASPAGSRIEVSKDGDRFRVRVAYRMAALTSGEWGAATKHSNKEGMRSEIRQLSAQVTRDLFAYCGSRGIASISLTCNHTLLTSLVPHGATAEEIQILRSRARITQAKLYRVSLEGTAARNISNWHRAAADEVLKLLRVEYDGIDSIELSKAREVDRVEASEPLIF